jgi:hypothetical protein
MLKPNSLKVWISKRIPLCRTFVRRLIDSLSNVNNRNAKILLSSELFDDIAWWVKFMPNKSSTTFDHLTCPIKFPTAIVIALHLLYCGFEKIIIIHKTLVAS